MEDVRAQPINWGKKLFELRDYTPIPLIILALLVEKPVIASVTFGLILIFFGEALRVYCSSFITGISRTRSSSLGGRLVTEGPFTFVRNPIYVSNFFVTIGLAVYTGVVWFVFLSIFLFCLQYYFIVLYEESLLRAKFGEEYIEYCQKVPAFFPKKLPRLDALEVPPDVSLSKAIKNEKRTFMAIFSVLFALVLFSN